MELKPFPAENIIEKLGNLSPMSNFFFGGIARYNVEKHFLNALKKHNVEVSEKNTFLFYTFVIHELLDKPTLDKINSFGCYHDQFGEGFDEKNNEGNTFKSYAFQLPDNSLIHVGFDHRGTIIGLPKETTEETFAEIIQWAVDVCYEHNNGLFYEYLKICNK